MKKVQLSLQNTFYKRGFTLVELVIVIAVIGILATVTVISYNLVTNNTHIDSVKSDVINAAAVITHYKSDNGTYPSDCATAGVTVSRDNTVVCTGNASTFCVTVSYSAIAYYISESKTAPTSGTCVDNTAFPNTQKAKLLASDGAASDYFGTTVDISGYTSAVGAASDDDKGSASGSVYIYTGNPSNSTWTQQTKIVPADGAAGDNFGNAVAIDGDTLVAAAYLDDDLGSNSGSVYVYKRTGTTWALQQKLTPSDGVAGDNFGYSVDITGDTIIVGSPYDDDKGTSSGSAYIFTRSGSTWTQQAKFVASDGVASDYFGMNVSISNNTAVVGAYADGDLGALSGAAYVFTRGTNTWVWSQQQKLTASDGAASDYFGYSVSVDGNYIVVGAYGDDDKGSASGSAYVYYRSGITWSQQAKLKASDGAASDYFAYTVAISGDIAVIGSYQDDDMGSASGSAYVFVRNGTNWVQKSKLVPPDGAAADNFGFNVGISGAMVVVGARTDADLGTASGSAYTWGP